MTALHGPWVELYAHIATLRLTAFQST